MKLIYIAGPYSAPDSWTREQNIRVAEDVCATFWRHGVAAVCVHTMSRHFFGFVPEEHAIAIDMEILDRCDAVFLLPGWQESSGTKAELNRAIGRGVMVFGPTDINAAIQWGKS